MLYLHRDDPRRQEQHWREALATAPQPPAEAQAQGGGEVVAQQQGQTVYQIENDPDEWFDVGQDMYEGHDGSRKRILYTTAAPPSAPVGVEDIIEAFDEITGLCRHLRQGGPAPEDLHGLSGALDEAIGIAGDMLDALAAQQQEPKP